MATDYPTGIDAFVRPPANAPMSSPSHSQHHDSIYDALEAIETELGVTPSGVEASVAARLTAIEARLTALETP